MIGNYFLDIMTGPSQVGGGCSPPVFGQTVNPISTRGGADYAHHSTTSPPPGFSDLATGLNIHDCLVHTYVLSEHPGKCLLGR